MTVSCSASPTQFSRPSPRPSTAFASDPEQRLTVLLSALSLETEKMTALHYWSLVELAKKIRTRATSPREVVELHLKRMAELQPRLNALVHADEIGARQQAKAAETSLTSTEPLGALSGVPLT